MKNLSDMATTMYSNEASTKQSQTDGKEYLSRKEMAVHQEHNSRPPQNDSWTGCVTTLVINKLFAKLAARYGSRWTSQWSDTDLLKLGKNEWYEELKHLKVGDIKTGLDSWKGVFPPNIIEFKRECMPAPCYKLFNGNALPAPKNKSVGEKALKAIREKLL